MTDNGTDGSVAGKSHKPGWMTPLRVNLLLIALLITALNGGIICLCYVAITRDGVSQFVIGALIGLLPTGITGLVGLGTTLLNENRER